MLTSLNNQANCTCGSEQFQCQWGGGYIVENFDTNTNTNIFINTNKKTGCVANDLRCNGNFDCSDRSDELGCREVEQPGGTNVAFRKKIYFMKCYTWAKIPSVTDASAPRFHQCSPNYKYQQLLSFMAV